MTVQQQIARLESLLDRIQKNVSKGRVQAAAPPVAEIRRAPELAPSPVPEPFAAVRPIAPAYEAPPESGPATDRTDAPAERPSAPPTMPPRAVAEADASTETEVEELDMSEAELVELSVEPVMVDTGYDGLSEPAPPLANELVDEPAPESAPRPAAQAMDEAELEPPVKTPPPESGKQIVAIPVGIAGETLLEATESAASLEPDLSGSTISRTSDDEPSAAQLGETVELEGADGPPARIELLSAPMNMEAAPDAAPPDDLEMSLPQRQYGGGYDADLAPPSRASADLARHREQADAVQATEPPVSLSSPASVEHFASDSTGVVISMEPVIVDPVVPSEPSMAAAASPVIVERPTLGSMPVVEMRRAAVTTLPNTFLELLDASLAIDVSV